MIAEILKKHILKSKESRYSICKKTGIDNATLSKFLSGGIDIKISTAGKLLEFFGLEIKEKAKSIGGKK